MGYVYLEGSDNSLTAFYMCSITEIAETLGQLEDMEYVDLGMLQLTGPLDSACGLAATRKLESLDLLSNGLTGAVTSFRS